MDRDYARIIPSEKTTHNMMCVVVMHFLIWLRKAIISP